MKRSEGLHHPWLYPPRTPAAFANWITRARTDEFESFLIRRRDDGQLVGFCNLSNIVRGSLQGCFMGFGAVAGQAGRGQMRAGIGLVLDRAFGPLRLHRVEANVQPGNERSLALVRSLGFVREGFSERYLKVGGRWRDHERWAIRAELWRG